MTLRAKYPVEYTAQDVLALAIDEQDASKGTVGSYLTAHISDVWNDSGDRPRTFGFAPNDWRQPVMRALVFAGYAQGTLDRDNQLYSASAHTVKDAIETALTLLQKADYSTLKLPEPVRDWYVVDFDTDISEGNARPTEFLSGPFTEEEARQDKAAQWNTTAYRDTSAVVQFKLPEGFGVE